MINTEPNEEETFINMLQFPNKLGPAKNLYQFSQLRDRYRDMYIVTAQKLSNVDQALNNEA